MDQQRFDALVREFASTRSRRQVLKKIAGAGAGVLLASLGIGASEAMAAPKAGAKKCYGTGSKCAKGTNCCSGRCTNRVCKAEPASGGCTSDSQCEDGNLCTVNTCVAGMSSSAPVTCPDDANPCTFGQCDSSTGSCIQLQVVDGTLCGTNSICQGGVCKACSELTYRMTQANTACPDPATGLYVCTDSRRDPNNCGSCGTSCGTGETCCNTCVASETCNCGCSSIGSEPCSCGSSGSDSGGDEG